MLHKTKQILHVWKDITDGVMDGWSILSIKIFCEHFKWQIKMTGRRFFCKRDAFIEGFCTRFLSWSNTVQLVCRKQMHNNTTSLSHCPSALLSSFIGDLFPENLVVEKKGRPSTASNKIKVRAGGGQWESRRARRCGCCISSESRPVKWYSPVLRAATSP